MRLKRLVLTNFQGASCTHELSPLTVITGDNFSGKSRLLNAIAVLLLGYCPGLGKRPGDTFSLASSDTMSVMGDFELDDGRVQPVARSYIMVKGSVVSKGPKEHMVPEMLLDASTYFGMSGADRVNYILSNFTADELVDSEITKLVSDAIAGHADQDAKKKVMATVDELLVASIDEGVNTSTLLETLVATLKEALSESNARVKAQTGFLQTGVQLQADDATVVNVQPQIDAARLKRDQLIERRTALENQGKPDAGVVQRNGRRKNAEMALSQLHDRTDEIAHINRQIESLQQFTLDDAKKLPPSPINSDQAREISALIASNESTLLHLGKQRAALQEKVDAQMKYECPCCGETGADCKASKRLLRQWRQEDDKAVRDQALCTDVLQAKRKELEAIMKHVQAVNTVAAAAHDREIEIGQLKHKLSFLNHDQSDYVLAKQRVIDLGVIELETAPAIDAAAVDEVRRTVTLLEQDIEGLEQKQRAYVARQQDRLRHEQAVKANQQATAEVDVYKLALEAVTKLQQVHVDGAFNKLLHKARLFTDGILKTPLEYSIKTGDMGRIENGTWIPHWTFSGTEKLLAYTGLSVALVQDAKLRIVLLDEMGRVADGRKGDVVVRLIKLINDKVIDQAILVDTGWERYAKLRETDGATLIRL